MSDTSHGGTSVLDRVRSLKERLRKAPAELNEAGRKGDLNAFQAASMLINTGAHQLAWEVYSTWRLLRERADSILKSCDREVSELNNALARAQANAEKALKAVESASIAAWGAEARRNAVYELNRDISNGIGAGSEWASIATPDECAAMESLTSQWETGLNLALDKTATLEDKAIVGMGRWIRIPKNLNVLLRLRQSDQLWTLGEPKSNPRPRGPHLD